jgi:hypothetical protein
LKFITFLAALAAITSSTAFCQQLYKCGVTFQDKPCDSEIQKKYSAVTGSFTKEQVSPGADTQCAELGAKAVPIIQSRSGNETLESLHAKVDLRPIGRQEKIKEKELINTVYAKKGSPIDIRRAIEIDCMDKKLVTLNNPQAVAPNTMSWGNTNSSRAAIDASRAAVGAARAAAEAARYSR